MELALRKSSVTLTEPQTHGQRKGGEDAVARIREDAMSLPTAAVGGVTAREQPCSRGRAAGTAGPLPQEHKLAHAPDRAGSLGQPGPMKEVMCN